jgi:type IV pilus assembly protein PilV
MANRLPRSLAYKRADRSSQHGAMLLEAMIGILIFSIGILAMIAMQGLAVGYVSDAKYRSDAAFFANELLGQIWVDRGNLANYVYPGGTSPNVTAWAARVTAGLPGAAATPPAVTVDVLTGTVTIAIYWTPPNAQTAHNYQSIALVSNP